MKIVPMSVELVDSMGSDLSVVNAARVSFNKESEWEYKAVEEDAELEGLLEDGWLDATQDHHYQYHVQKLSDKDAKLVAYLAKHGHWTPFAHAFLSFRIKAPIFVARQLVKHQVGLAWNEVSRRYVDSEPEFWLPSSDGWRGKPINAKQGSTGVMPDPDIEVATSPMLALRYAWECYTDLIKAGYAPEQARMVLPQNTHTEWIWSGSLAAFARVCKLRLDPHAQAETQEIAKQIEASVPSSFSHSWKALLA